MEKGDLAPPKRIMVGIAAISTGASESPSAGHFYWHYLGLYRNNQTPDHISFRLVSGPGVADPVSLPFFSDQAHSRRFRTGLSTVSDYNFAKAERVFTKLEAEGVRAYYLYEGSLSDLAFILYLAPKMPNSVFVYNFFWPLEWKRILESGEWTSRWLSHLLRRSPPNVRFTADTPKFADYLEKKVHFSLDSFPAFSPFNFCEIGDAVSQEFDLLLVCKRAEELTFALEVVRIVARKKPIRVAVQGPFGDIDNNGVMREISGAKFSGFETNLDGNGYTQLLMSSDVLFLAYQKTHYSMGSSGKLVDAYQAGCKILVPENSGLSSQAEHLGVPVVETFPHNDPKVAAEKILKLMTMQRTPSRRDRSARHLFDYMHDFVEVSREIQGANSHPQLDSQHDWVRVLMAGSFFRIRFALQNLRLRSTSMLAKGHGLCKKIHRTKSRRR